MDLTLFRHLLLSTYFQDLHQDLSIFDNKSCTFYYDESNNIRKLWLKDNNFNAPIDCDFVLGGVMHFGEEPSADIDILKRELRLQKTSKELKFKHICKSPTFLDCLNNDKVICFLEWLLDSDLYIHCFNVNNLYFAIVDIIDSIDDEIYIPYTFGMKDALYRLVLHNYDDFYRLLIECNYPNLSEENISVFYNHLIGYIDKAGPHISFDTEILRQGLKVAQKQKECIFLSGNEEKTVLKDYSPFYIRPIGVFPYANHIFDHECCIEDVVNTYEFYIGGNQIKNYKFTDSISEPLIQISDCVVGLLGKYYTYINRISLSPLDKVFRTYTDKQSRTMQLLAKLFHKSESISKLLFCAVESKEERLTSSAVLETFFER